MNIFGDVVSQEKKVNSDFSLLQFRNDYNSKNDIREDKDES